MKFNLRAANIIVIGGATGIGYSAAQKLLDAGAKSVILASRNESKLNTAKQALKFNEKQCVYVLPFDISDVKSHDEMIREAREMIGEIPDGLVISSGVDYDGSNWKGFNISETDWEILRITCMLIRRRATSALFPPSVRIVICFQYIRLPRMQFPELYMHMESISVSGALYSTV